MTCTAQFGYHTTSIAMQNHPSVIHKHHQTVPDSPVEAAANRGFKTGQAVTQTASNSKEKNETIGLSMKV